MCDHRNINMQFWGQLSYPPWMAKYTKAGELKMFSIAFVVFARQPKDPSKARTVYYGNYHKQVTFTIISCHEELIQELINERMLRVPT